MNKVSVVKVIVKLYFIGALAGSFIHLVHAGHKGGLATAEAWSLPFMIDGLAVIGMIMRSDSFSNRTRKIGFRTQCIMGMFSLAGNVYAAHNVGGAAYGVGIVALFIASEWLSDNIESATDEVVSEAERIAQQAADAQAAKKASTIAKRKATLARNKRIKAQQTKALEGMLK